MPAKPNAKNWTDVQMAITTVAITASLGLWNIFATPAKKPTASLAEVKPTQPPTQTPLPLPTETALPQPTPTAATLALRPVKIIFGGKAPKQQVIQIAAPPEQTAKNNRRQNDTNNTDNSAQQPAPVVSEPPATGTS